MKNAFVLALIAGFAMSSVSFANEHGAAAPADAHAAAPAETHAAPKAEKKASKKGKKEHKAEEHKEAAPAQAPAHN